MNDPESRVELVRVTTSDGVRLDAAWQAPMADAPHDAEPREAVLCVHGTGSNFYASTLMESLSDRLLKLGLGTLRINTRGHDLMSTASTAQGGRRAGAAYEIVDDCRHDLAAWVAWLAERGISKIALLGHSLGAIKSIYYLAHEPHPAIATLVAISPPRLSHSYFADSKSGEEFVRVFAQAEEAVARGAGNELIEIRFPLPYVVTAASYLDKYGRDERYNVLRLLERLDLPTLFVYGGQELQTNIAFMGMAEELEQMVQQGRPATVAVIAGADHFYTTERPALAHRAASWLTKTM